LEDGIGSGAAVGDLVAIFALFLVGCSSLLLMASCKIEEMVYTVFCSCRIEAFRTVEFSREVPCTALTQMIADS